MAVALQPWQWALIAVAWLVFFLAPAIWLGRKARRDGEAPFVWVVLTLVASVLGVAEYYHHRSIVARRAKRAARAAAAARGEGSNPPEEVGASRADR